MPKMKSHSGARKRFKVSGTGKPIHEHTNRQHKFQEKTSRRARRLAVDATASPADLKRVKRLLGL